MKNKPFTARFPAISAWTRSLRANLVLGNIIITFLAVAGMGYYVTYRAQQSNTYLTTQLDKTVFQQAQDRLTATSNTQTVALDNFFISIRRDISILSSTLGRLLSQQTEFPNYWDATLSLTALPSGSLDNSNSEPASVFVPAGIEVTNPLILELNAARQIDFLVPSLLDSNPDVVAIYFGGTSKETVYYPNIDLANIVPPDFDVTSRPWYTNATINQDPDRKAVWSDPYLDAALHGLIITSSKPVLDAQGNFRGVTAMDIQLTRITAIVADIKVGKTGYAFLIDKNMRLIAMPENGYLDLGTDATVLPLGELVEPAKITSPVTPEFWSLVTKMSKGESGLGTVTINGTERYVVYQSVPEVGYSLAIIVPSQELLADAIAANQQVAQVTRNTILISFIIVVAILAVALLAALGLGNRLTRPLVTLTATAEEITKGNLNAKAKRFAYHEIDTLANAFNSMTDRLKETIGTLENRVAERTIALERRADQVQAAVEVGQAVASERNLNTLLEQTTRLINQRFGFYHVGIFLVDKAGEYAVLQASNSQGGRRMLESGHRLKVGETGIVGHVTSEGYARIALDVGSDAVFFDNPELPTTRSEIALPLKVAGRILGALDVQSEKENAFSSEDISSLQILADQIAIAIENARLIDESRNAVETARRAYEASSRTGWQKLLQEEKEIGYVNSDRNITLPISGEADKEFMKTIESLQPVISKDERTLYLPISVRGFAIGCLRLSKPENRPAWNKDDIQSASAVIDQLGIALDGARLFTETTSRAERERMVSEITTKIRSTTDPQTMLVTAIEELKQALGTPDIHIKPISNLENPIADRYDDSPPNQK